MFLSAHQLQVSAKQAPKCIRYPEPKGLFKQISLNED